MAELKTKPTDASVAEFVRSIEDESRRHDCEALLEMMQRVSGADPRMWGPSIVGFDSFHYKYASGREGEWFAVGFASRKRDLTIYLSEGFERYDELLGRLGKYHTGKSCLYVKHLADVDNKVLEELLAESVAFTRQGRS